MKIVYAKEPRVIAHGGQRIALRPGEPWDGDDPLVKAYPDAFVDGPSTVRSTRDASGLIAVDEPPIEAVDEPPIERATRAPGEKRNVRRPKAGQ